MAQARDPDGWPEALTTKQASDMLKADPNLKPLSEAWLCKLAKQGSVKAEQPRGKGTPWIFDRDCLKCYDAKWIGVRYASTKCGVDEPDLLERARKAGVAKDCGDGFWMVYYPDVPGC